MYFPQEERWQSTTLRSELGKLEAALEKSGDQTREELRTVKQMFEQSEQSRNTSMEDCEVCVMCGVVMGW